MCKEYIYIYIYIYVCVSQVGVYGIMVVSEIPDLHRKFREACTKNLRYMLSKSELVVPSMVEAYNKKQKTIRVQDSRLCFGLWASELDNQIPRQILHYIQYIEREEASCKYLESKK